MVPHKYSTDLNRTIKGQLISKWFFGVVDFLQKPNENKSTWGIIVVKSNYVSKHMRDVFSNTYVKVILTIVSNFVMQVSTIFVLL